MLRESSFLSFGKKQELLQSCRNKFRFQVEGMIELNLYTIAFVPSAVDFPFAASVSKVPSVPAVIMYVLRPL
jgi:hypothetical protein